MQGLGLGDMLLGLPFTAAGALGDSSQKMRTVFYGGYIQDDWRVTPSLTLNLGHALRILGVAHGADREGAGLRSGYRRGRACESRRARRRSSIRTGTISRRGWASHTGRAFAKNTVIRGGFGIYYATDNWNELQFEVMGPPFYQSQTLTSDPTKPTLLMSDMLPSADGLAEPESVHLRPPQSHALSKPVVIWHPAHLQAGLSGGGGIRRQHRAESRRSAAI